MTITEQQYEQLRRIPRSDLPESHNDFASLYEITGEKYLRKSIGDFEGFYLAAEAGSALGVSSLKKNLGIQVNKIAEAHVHTSGDTITVSQPYGREIWAFCSIGLDTKVAEETEKRYIDDMHKVAEFFRQFFPDKKVIEKEPQWIPTRYLERRI